jgi:hypothetical protein
MPTLIIEDGSVVAGANSFITVAELEAYLTDLGRTLTAATEDAKEVLLIKAQRAISTRLTYWGDPVSQDQRTCLPRNWNRYIDGFLVGNDVVPQDFKDAQAEMAWSIDQGADPFADRSTATQVKGAETASSAKAGPVETSKTYGDAGVTYDPLAMSNYVAAMALLKPYTRSTSAQIKMVRG